MAAGIFLDLADSAVFTAGTTFNTAISGTGGQTGVDMVSSVGNMISALLTSSATSGSGNVTIKIQQSDDNSSFSDITGATFNATSTATDLQLISFQLQKRYVRAFATLNSGTSVTMQVTFLGQRKVTPTGKGGWANESGAS